MGNSELDNKYNDFLQLLSHEMRTPLTSIRGFAQTMINAYDKLSDEQKIKFLKIIDEQSNRLIHLVENMLMSSKYNKEADTFIFKSFNINEIIENCIQLVKIKHPNYSFVFKKNNSVPHVWADVEKTQQVLVNILDNACKYSPSCSKIEVILKTCFENGEEKCIVSICDEGCGISEENKDKIFDKFTRLENLNTQNVEGSGLGLYIAKNIMEKMNGDITCHANLPKGCVFCISFCTLNPNDEINRKLSSEDVAK